MKKVGTSYLHHREISAQEAVFRVTGLRLRECSRKVEFIPVGENPCRMSIPLKDLEKQQSFKSSNRKRSNSDSADENDDENKIWMNNLVDRYKGRPHIDMFIKMCLARFGSEYSVLGESQLPQKINEETTFKLDGNLGHIRKRTRTSPAVIKYPRFSQETSPEKYFLSILFCQELEDAANQLHETDPKEDAWCELCPESELNRRECIDEGKVTSVIEEDLSEATIPDLNKEMSSSSVGTNLLSVSLTKNEIIPRLRSLNVKQKRILYKVRDWCIQKANGKTPKPLHVFITGGAGTDDPSNPSNQLWNGLFNIAELDEIMRQREDGLFAKLLNRMRVKQKNESLSYSDKDTLKQCIGDGPDEVLHIYPTNAEVDTFNKEMILKLCTDSKLIEAEDYEKNKTSGKLTLKKIHCTKSDVCLPISILLAEGARVMLIKNEDTADGLVNGVMGTVISIKDYSPNSLPSSIFVLFDNERPSSEDIPLSTCVRKQFPLKLAWACTIHKVQGLTVEECVVDLNKCFTYGQAYVALSRVTSKSGLHIKSIESEKLDKKIFCDPDIVKGVAEMTRFLPEVEDEREEQTDIVQIMYHNIQGLQTHAEDLKQNPDFIGVDYICLTETWANQEFACFEMIGYDGFHLPRSQAFENDDSYYSSLKEMQHGGVCVFYKHSSETELCNLASNLECIVFKITTENILVATIYRTQKYNVGKFLENLATLICKLQILSEKVVIIGDFNQDILKEYSGPNPCEPNPCNNGGTCTELTADSINCDCDPAWIGDKCDDPVPNPCEPNPCNNAGTCTELTADSINCDCDPAWIGDKCDGIRRKHYGTIKQEIVNKIGSIQWNSKFRDRDIICQLITDCRKLTGEYLPYDAELMNNIESTSRKMCYDMHILKNQIHVIQSAKTIYEVVPSENVAKFETLSRGDHIKFRTSDGKADHSIVTEINQNSSTFTFVQNICDYGNTPKIKELTLKFNDVPEVFRFDYTYKGRNYLIPDVSRIPREASATVAEYFSSHPAAFRPGLKNDCESFVFCCTLGHSLSAYQMKMLIIAFGTLKVFDEHCFIEMQNNF
ncbi:unnamed protein product [Mytilus edulis]|uniref:EGF-like domain-containing protein n=1 Tax=Mytilus edulis TaxID=6550 RepID=A0A8S3PRX8_MYTED|nr:unnamed protein product [Mytilus edulis]